MLGREKNKLLNIQIPLGIISSMNLVEIHLILQLILFGLPDRSRILLNVLEVSAEVAFS
jgi:hypothetical protein